MNDLSICGEACNCVKCRSSVSIKFHELEDGAQFMFTQEWANGSRTVWQKTLEDGGEHNAVKWNNYNLGVLVSNDTLVIPVQ